MRLIDAEQMAVDESAAYIMAQAQIDSKITRDVNTVVHMKIQRLIADTPTVDAVPVVRCKDCKRGKPWKNKFGHDGFKCELFCMDIETDAFRSYGEAKSHV